MFHLTARVAWHDSRWNGTVCRQPSCNAFCAALDRIREERDDAREDAIAGKRWNTLESDELPPCKAESGAFMNDEEWSRRFVHPYAGIAKAEDTHGHLKPTLVKIPAYATFVVPFAWMLKSEQEAIDGRLPTPLPPDDEAPFNSPWVFGRERQEAILKLFASRLTPDRSLVFFYCKEGQPLGDTITRLVMGVGRIANVAQPKAYDVSKKKPTHLMWDLLIRHTIRPDGEDGFLLPYHDYLEPTGDAAEDARRQQLLHEIAVPADPAHVRVFSYAAELAPADIALSTLVRCLESVRKIREHGIAKGPWERREEWLNQQIAQAWQDRGPFPGLGPVLEALGMRLGTALALELRSSGAVKADADPWPTVDAIFRGKQKPPQPAYAEDLKAIRETWKDLPDDRRALLKLLSRFALTSEQALRWFDPKERAKGTAAKVSDEEILANPYRISEVDLGDWNDSSVSVGTIDRGLLIEGDDATMLFDLSRPERSETARRNTNIFQSVIRVADDTVPFAEHLIHRTEKGHMVRSKSELVIANMLFQLGIPYDYERICDGTSAPGRLRPDFSFVTADGDLIVWEHLGMLSRPDYKRGWEWKREWYSRNGFVDGKTLFTSTEDAENGLDSALLRKTADTIKYLIE